MVSGDILASIPQGNEVILEIPIYIRQYNYCGDCWYNPRLRTRQQSTGFWLEVCGEECAKKKINHSIFRQQAEPAHHAKCDGSAPIRRRQEFDIGEERSRPKED